MSLPRFHGLAYAQLMRLPNLFTAVADPLAGWLIAASETPQLALVLGASACLYTSGVVLNDCFDFQEDCRVRPERPLPSGAISLSAAWSLGAVLMVAGVILAVTAGRLWLGIGLASLVLFYNAWAKHSVFFGVTTLGACRFLNFTLGLGTLANPLWLAPTILAFYVAGVSLLARREAGHKQVQLVVRRLLLNLIVLDAILVIVFSFNWPCALLVLALLLPAWALSRILAMT